MTSRSIAMACLSMVGFLGCDGVIGEPSSHGSGRPSSRGPGPTDPAAMEEPNGSEADPAPGVSMVEPMEADTGLRRLETDQFIRTVTSRVLLFHEEVPWPLDHYLEELAEHVAHRIPSSAQRRAQLPAPFGDFSGVIVQAATQFAAKAQVIFGDCALDDDAANDRACLQQFFAVHGPTFWRREVPADEVDAFVEPFVATTPLDRPRLRRFFAAILFSPNFMLVVEHGQPGTEADATAPLTAYELASRLSYFLWRDAPDPELLESAGRGALLQEDELVRQASRLLEHPKSDALFENIARQWLHVDEEDMRYGKEDRFLYAHGLYFARNPDGSLAREMVVQSDGTRAERYKKLESLDLGLAEDVSVAEFLGSLKSLAHDELTQFVRYVVLSEAGTVGDLLLTEIAPARDPRLAKIYGVPVWDGTSRPPVHESGRGGVLGRLAFVAATTTSTRPIIRGVRIWRHVLCRDLPEPPANVTFTEPEGRYTTRELVELSTAAPACAACHGRLNDFAFALEGIDNLGQIRTKEPFFGDLPMDRLLNPTSGQAEALEDSWLAVDTAAQPRLAPGEGTPVDGAYELAQAIAGHRAPEVTVLDRGGVTGDVYRCFASNLIEIGSDGALVSDEDALAVEAAVRSGSVRDAILTLVRTASFRHRTFEPEER